MSNENYGELIQETSRGAVYKVNTEYGVIYDIRSSDGFLRDSTPVKSNALAHINDTDWIAEYRKEHIVSLPLADDAYAVINKYLHGEEGFTDKDENYHKFGVLINELSGDDSYEFYITELESRYPTLKVNFSEDITDDEQRKLNILSAMGYICLFVETGYDIDSETDISVDPQKETKISSFSD